MRKIIQFLRPSIGKIVVTIVLLVLAHGVQILIRAGITDYWVIGVPFHFQQTWGPCLSPETVCRSFNWFLLIIDIIFWYLISCFMVFLWKKYKKK